MNPSEKCVFYMENKRRNCKFDAISNSQYCHYHSENQDFVFCPIDPSHAILKSKLETHLKICPKLKYEQTLKSAIWFSKGLNSKPEIPEKPEEEKKEIMLETYEIKAKNEEIHKKEKILLDLEAKNPDFLINLAMKIDLMFEKAVKLYNEEIEETSKGYFIPILEQKSLISHKQKDEKQLELMLELMKRYSLLEKDLVYIEYGAGKGHLSHEVAISTNSESAYVLLEKEPRRNKFDKNHRNNKNFIRLRTDISDFNINQLPQILNDFKPKSLKLNIIGISKHMCGGATDLTLNSLLKLEEKQGILNGMCIITCCHHRCSIDCYSNKGLLKDLGLKEEESEVFFKMSSWSVTTLYEQKKEEIKEFLGSDRKTEIGFKVKRIIDIGRCLFIKEKTGKKAAFVKYCDLDLTPENFAIVLKT